MENFQNLIRTENSNVLIPTEVGHENVFYAEHCFSTDGFKDNIEEFSLDFDGFNTKEERDLYIENNILVSKNMDFDVTIARKVFFDEKLNVGDTKLFFVEEKATNKRYGKGGYIVSAIKGEKNSVLLFIFTNFYKESFDLEINRKDYTDFLNFNSDDEVFKNNFTLKF